MRIRAQIRPSASPSSQKKWFTAPCPFLLTFLLLNLFAACKAQLSYDFYDASCPNLAGVVQATVTASVIRNPTTPAALLRLFFHDCQVQGCDGSILLDTQAGGIISELEAVSNLGIRRLEVIDAIKAATESVCPNTVSCSDLVVLAAREAVRMTGGPFIEVPLGRRDGNTASSARADAELPSAASGFARFLQVFQSKGMTLEESVAILGGHTLGVGHCPSVASRLYPQRDQSLGPVFYNVLRLTCPPSRAANRRSRAVLLNDFTPVIFDNQYFSNSKAGRGLFRVDSEVASNPQTAPIVSSFSADGAAFFRAFSSAFVKLSLSSVLTGSQGSIRSNCRRAT